jgi:hypothetical protein
MFMCRARLMWCEVSVTPLLLLNQLSLSLWKREVTDYIYSRRSNLGVPIFLKDKRAVRRNLAAFFSYALHLGVLLLYDAGFCLVSSGFMHVLRLMIVVEQHILSIPSKPALSCIPRYCTFMMQRYAWDMAIWVHWSYSDMDMTIWRYGYTGMATHTYLTIYMYICMSVDFLLQPQFFDYFTLKLLKHNTATQVSRTMVTLSRLINLIQF